jgi:hypothetical protein
MALSAVMAVVRLTALNARMEGVPAAAPLEAALAETAL